VYDACCDEACGLTLVIDEMNFLQWGERACRSAGLWSSVCVVPGPLVAAGLRSPLTHHTRIEKPAPPDASSCYESTRCCRGVPGEGSLTMKQREGALVALAFVSLACVNPAYHVGIMARAVSAGDCGEAMARAREIEPDLPAFPILK